MKNSQCTIALVLLLTGCGSFRPGFYKEGLELFPNPRTGDSPGTIIRTRGSDWKHVSDISSQIDIHGSYELVPTISLNLNNGLVASFLKIVEASFGAGRSNEFTFEMNGPVLREITNDDIKPAVNKAMQKLEPEKGWRYWVIRETQSSTNFTISNKKGMFATAKIRPAINVSTNIQVEAVRDRHGEVKMSVTSSVPYRVFFKREQIVPSKKGGTGETIYELRRSKNKEPLLFEKDSN